MVHWAKVKGKFDILLRDITLPLSASFVALGVFLLIVGVASFWFKGSSPEPLRSWAKTIGNFDICMVGLAPFLLMFAGWYLGENILRRREFGKLIRTASKEKFIKNMDRIEELAWNLSSQHERRVRRKKKEFNIR